MPTSRFAKHLQKKLYNQYHITINEKDSPIVDKKIEEFIHIASLISDNYKKDKKSEDLESDIIHDKISPDDPAYSMAEGFIERIKEKKSTAQQMQRALRPLPGFQ